MSKTLVKTRQRTLLRIARGLGGTLGDTDDFVDPRDPVERLIASETAPMITHREWLGRHRLVFPAPGTLTADRVPSELKRLIAALAFARVFIDGTNHLSDIQLYDRLFSDVLDGEEPDIPRMENEAFHWSLSEETQPHSKVWLAYYADAEQRAEYRTLFPKRAMPPRRTFPFNRDKNLPRPGREPAI